MCASHSNKRYKHFTIRGVRGALQTAAIAQQTLNNERAADAHLRGIDRRQGGQTIQTHKEK